MTRSCYVLEIASGPEVQLMWSTFLVYRDREHIRSLVRYLYFEADPHTTAAHLHEGQTADLWLIERGRRVGHVDLYSLMDIPGRDSREKATIDWARFDAVVPAALAGPLLRHGEELRLLAVQEDFLGTDSNLAFVYPDTPIRYGMQVWVDGELSDQPYEEYPDPDPPARYDRCRSLSCSSIPTRGKEEST